MKSIFILIIFIASSKATSLYARGLDDLINHYANMAMTEDSSFAGFDSNRGKDLYLREHVGGKKDTPSCTTCHTKNPAQAGKTRAGKKIEPMATSVNPKRYQTLKKAEKWFRRNCKSVLGRECTTTEKGDFLTFMNNS